MFKKPLFKKIWVENVNILFCWVNENEISGYFLCFFWPCWNHHFCIFSRAFVVSAGPRPTQPNPASQPSPAQPSQPASQPTHPKITNSASICVKHSKNTFSDSKIIHFLNGMVGARSPQKQEDTGRTVPSRNMTDPKLTPKMSTGNHSRGHQKHELLFLIVFAVLLFFGSSSDVSYPGFLDPQKSRFLKLRLGCNGH